MAVVPSSTRITNEAPWNQIDTPSEMNLELDELSNKTPLDGTETVMIKDGNSWKITTVQDISDKSTSVYASISSNANQQPSDTNANIVTLNQNDVLSGITHSTSSNPGVITIQKKGVYVIVATYQVGRTTTGGTIIISGWIKKNGTDVTDSGMSQALATTDVLKVMTLNYVIPLDIGDTISFYQSIDTTGKGAGLLTSMALNGPTVGSVDVIIFKI